MVRLVGASRSIAVAAQATIEQLTATHARIARREHGRIMTANPRPNAFVRHVDGREGVPEESVRPFGIIVYDYVRLAQVVQYAFEVLFSLSPVLSGEYRASHMLFIDGAPAANLAGWKPGQEISITNTVPYARKIEIPAMRLRVPGSAQVYQQAERRLKRRFGNIAEIRFTYRAVIESRQIDQMAQPSAGQPWYWGGAAARGGGATAHNRSNVRFPALIIRSR